VDVVTDSFFFVRNTSCFNQANFPVGKDDDAISQKLNQATNIAGGIVTGVQKVVASVGK
jgi:hypothetical protein